MFESRGVVMNPVDHPHAGGEGKAPIAAAVRGGSCLRPCGVESLTNCQLEVFRLIGQGLTTCKSPSVCTAADIRWKPTGKRFGAS